MQAKQSPLQMDVPSAAQEWPLVDLGFSKLSIFRHHPDGQGGGSAGHDSNKAGLSRQLAELKDLRADVRARAVWALGDSADTRVRRALAPLLFDPEYKVREAAAHVLGGNVQQTGAPLSSRLAEVLGQVLQTDPHAAVRRAAATALGRGMNTGAFYSLMAALSDAYPEVVAAAAWAMGQLGDMRAVEPLQIVSTHQEPMVRAACVRALGKIKCEYSLETLLAALKDKEVEVCWEAAEALGELKNPKAARALVDAAWHKSRDVSEAAVRSLVLCGPAAGPFIEATLRAHLQRGASGSKADPAYVRLERGLSLIRRNTQ